MDMPENLWNAVALARSVKMQGEQDAQERANGKQPTIRGYNEDSEEYSGRP